MDPGVEVTRKAHARGVRIVYGTDSGVYPHALVGKQFAWFVRCGMSPIEAIRSATFAAAECMGWSDSVGSLAPGGPPTSWRWMATHWPTSPCSNSRRSSSRADDSSSTRARAERPSVHAARNRPPGDRGPRPGCLGRDARGRPRHRVHRRWPARGVGHVQPARVPRRDLPRAHRCLRSSARRRFRDGGGTGRGCAMLDADAEGLATFALATDDIVGDVARLQAAGSSIGAPVEGARTRPDGDTVRWRARPRQHSGPASRRS